MFISYFLFYAVVVNCFLALSTFSDVALALLLNRPYIYDYNMPTALTNKVSYMYEVVNGVWNSKVLYRPHMIVVPNVCCLL